MGFQWLYYDILKANTLLYPNDEQRWGRGSGSGTVKSFRTQATYLAIHLSVSLSACLHTTFYVLKRQSIDLLT